jgi:hypothetical protein
MNVDAAATRGVAITAGEQATVSFVVADSRNAARFFRL